MNDVYIVSTLLEDKNGATFGIWNAYKSLKDAQKLQSHLTEKEKYKDVRITPMEIIEEENERP